jgi:hypothetical protein
MKQLYLLLLLTYYYNIAEAQWQQRQYFDGADTALYNSFFMHFGADSTNVWQIGRPQKTIFNKAATIPNALVTDTINGYPINDTSSFTFGFKPSASGFGILALQWKQKLDYDTGYDGGIIEYSLDTGSTWKNVFNNPEVYNFYGFNVLNKDTLPGGEYAFTGTDTSWRDIWLCFDRSLIADSIIFRFTSLSDSIDNGREGWMIDNMSWHITIIHTVNKQISDEYLKVYPRSTEGIVHIEAEKTQELHIIESMELMDINGKVVERFGRSPVKYYINIANHENGLYFLKVNTNLKSKTFSVLLNKP